jgi:hypothetical protein
MNSPPLLYPLPQGGEECSYIIYTQLYTVSRKKLDFKKHKNSVKMYQVLT